MQLVKDEHVMHSRMPFASGIDPPIALCLHMDWKPDAGADDHGADKAHSHFILF